VSRDEVKKIDAGNHDQEDTDEHERGDQRMTESMSVVIPKSVVKMDFF
jgi:hypothetical protein